MVYQPVILRFLFNLLKRFLNRCFVQFYSKKRV